MAFWNRSDQSISHDDDSFSHDEPVCEQHDFSRREMVDIIREALDMCKKHHYLVRIGTMAAAVSLLVAMISWPYRLYSLFPDTFEYFSLFSWTTLIDLFSYDFVMGLLVMGGVGFLFLLYMIMPMWADASVIASVHHLKKDPELKLSFWRSLWVGLRRVFPLFEYESLTVAFDLSKLVTVVYLLMRFLSVDIILSFWMVFLVAGLFMLFFSVLLVYARYSVIIERGKVFRSIRRSMTLVAFYLSETFLLLMIVGFFVILVGLYTVLYFAFPAFIVFILQFLMQRFAESVAWWIGGTVALFMFYIFAKLVGFVRVFLDALWTLTFMELSARKEHKLVDGDEDDIS